MHQMMLGGYGRPDSLAKRLPILKEMFAPIMHALTEVEADKASFSRMRALVRQPEAHAVAFTASHGEDFCTGFVKQRDQPEILTTVIETFTSRSLQLRVATSQDATLSYNDPTWSCFCPIASYGLSRRVEDVRELSYTSSHSRSVRQRARQ
jgi:hypothetical protein